MDIAKILKPSRKKIITLIFFRLLMVLPHVVIGPLLGPNPNTPAFILSGTLIFLLSSIIKPQGIIVNYLIVCLLVEKIKKEYLRFLIIIFLSLAWLAIQTFAMLLVAL